MSLESSPPGRRMHGLSSMDIWTCGAKVLKKPNDFFTEKLV
jgi:hypothetical protein